MESVKTKYRRNTWIIYDLLKISSKWIAFQINEIRKSAEAPVQKVFRRTLKRCRFRMCTSDPVTLTTLRNAVTFCPAGGLSTAAHAQKGRPASCSLAATRRGPRVQGLCHPCGLSWLNQVFCFKDCGEVAERVNWKQGPIFCALLEVRPADSGPHPPAPPLPPPSPR